MSETLNIILLLIEILFLILFLPFLVFGIYEHIFGPEDAKRLLRRINSPLSYKQVIVIGSICAIVSFSIHIIRLVM